MHGPAPDKLNNISALDTDRTVRLLTRQKRESPTEYPKEVVITFATIAPLFKLQQSEAAKSLVLVIFHLKFGVVTVAHRESRYRL